MSRLLVGYGNCSSNGSKFPGLETRETDVPLCVCKEMRKARRDESGRRGHIKWMLNGVLYGARDERW